MPNTEPASVNGDRPATAASCSCGAWWTGLTRAHCAACHTTFSCDSAASQHRKGPYGGGRHCIDPATVGLIAVEKPYGRLWQNAGPEGGYGALHAAAAEPGAPGAAGGVR